VKWIFGAVLAGYPECCGASRLSTGWFAIYVSRPICTHAWLANRSVSVLGPTQSVYIPNPRDGEWLGRGGPISWLCHSCSPAIGAGTLSVPPAPGSTFIVGALPIAGFHSGNFQLKLARVFIQKWSKGEKVENCIFWQSIPVNHLWKISTLIEGTMRLVIFSGSFVLHTCIESKPNWICFEYDCGLQAYCTGVVQWPIGVVPKMCIRSHLCWVQWCLQTNWLHRGH